MRTKVSFAIIITLFVISCSERNSNPSEQDSQNQTPEVLDDDKAELELSYISKRYNANIIEELFAEAVEKNSELEEIIEELVELKQMENDSLESYEIYKQNNNAYWLSVQNYIDELSDSTVRSDIKEIFKILENHYKNDIAQHESIHKILNDKALQLKDNMIFLKLIVTEPMMANYQRNELPDINAIESIIKEYDSLMIKIDPYLEIRK